MAVELKTNKKRFDREFIPAEVAEAYAEKHNLELNRAWVILIARADQRSLNRRYAAMTEQEKELFDSEEHFSYEKKAS